MSPGPPDPPCPVGPSSGQILLVEDNPGDVRLIREALRASPLRNALHVARDGDEAMAFLRREGPWAQAPRPNLILLDLNLPRKDGREVLSEIKADPDLKRIPVLVLTTSTAAEDVRRSYDAHANCYLTKPVRLDDFRRVIKLVEEFWLTAVRLPPA